MRNFQLEYWVIHSTIQNPSISWSIWQTNCNQRSCLENYFKCSGSYELLCDVVSCIIITPNNIEMKISWWKSGWGNANVCNLLFSCTKLVHYLHSPFLFTTECNVSGLCPDLLVHTIKCFYLYCCKNKTLHAIVVPIQGMYEIQ